MRASSLLGLSAGWFLTALLCALDVGPRDPLFYPSLSLALPALIGLVASLRTRKQSAEPLSWGRVLGFGVVGALVVTASVLLIINALYPVELPANP